MDYSSFAISMTRVIDSEPESWMGAGQSDRIGDNSSNRDYHRPGAKGWPRRLLAAEGTDGEAERLLVLAAMAAIWPARYRSAGVEHPGLNPAPGGRRWRPGLRRASLFIKASVGRAKSV